MFTRITMNRLTKQKKVKYMIQNNFRENTYNFSSETRIK